jgi:zinc protease
VKGWPDRIRAVSAEQVRAAAQRYLDLRRAVTGYLVKSPAPPEKRS